ncbi:SNF2 family N-terminal domain-containing protein [Cubamyces lactineus]|nr:SNF2 family N-terminal domain-containing protein [Cubamyces lactineus]
MSARRRSSQHALPSVQPTDIGKASGNHVDDPPSVEDVRAQWVQTRREELDKVYDTHDTLIREAFHLEKFVSMLTYDPKVAKQDRSDVFQRFQAQYDLVDHTASAGPSRRTTRSAHTERLQILQVHAPAVPPPLPRNKVRKEEDSPSVAFWNIKAEAKSKGKQVHSEDYSAAPTFTRKGKGRQVVVEIPTRRVPAPTRAKPPVHDPIELGEEGPLRLPGSSQDNGLAPPPRKKRRIGQSADVGATDPSRHTRPRRHSRTSATVPGPSSDVVEESISAPPCVMNGTGQVLPSAAVPLSPVKHPIQRVKLIVRKPLPMYSHPLHRPKPPPFGGSVEALLNTFTYRYDDEVTPEQLEAELARELSVWKRVDRLRREGRMIGERSSFEFRPAQPQDPWGHIVREIERSKGRLVNSQRGAANVASKVKAHWSGASDKERKRIRALARNTVDMVIEEWKKAVYHVREQQRLEREEEERKLGQKHLDAILNQSGQILEVQLHDLARDSDIGSRSRSRSRSVSTPALDWSHTSTGGDPIDIADSDATNVSESEGGDDESVSDEASETSSEEGGISMLLPEDARETLLRTPSRSASMDADSSTPALDSHDAQEESDDEVAEALHRTSSVQPQLAYAGKEDRSHSPLEIINGFARHRAGSVELADRFSSTGTYVYGTTGKPAPSLDFPGGSLDEVLTLPTFSDGTLPPPHETAVVNGLEEATDATPTVPLAPNPNCHQERGAVESQGPKTPVAGPDDIVQTVETTSHPEDRFQASPATPATPAIDDLREDDVDDDVEEDSSIPYYLRPYAVAPVEWDPQARVKAPLLLRGTLRPYQQAGLEWLASIHARNLNGILADEMGLGKTIQTIALLAHLACDRGIWGPHLIIVPTSVLLNWEMEFKKFLPGFKVLSYHGNTKQRKELRQGWYNKYHFNVCITSYTLASRDAHVFKRKRWYYMILDEAHMIKNFKSQRWNTLLMFRSFRRLLLTGTPLQNNLTELWALLQFLMSGTDFANLKEFGEWFANPLEKAIELGAIDDETQQRVSKLHTVLRPYLLRRLKRDVEKELPQKFEHIVMCPLSKRQRFLYDEFMSRAETRHDLQSGVYQKIANILMQLRKVVNHPDLFEVRPIVTSFAMQRSAIADFEIKELLVRRRLLAESNENRLNLDVLGLQFVDHLGQSGLAAEATRRLDGSAYLPTVGETPGEPPPVDTRSIAGYKQYRAWQVRAATIARWSHIAYLNRLRTSQSPVYSSEALTLCRRFYQPLLPYDVLTPRRDYLSTPERIRSAIKSYAARAEAMGSVIDRFAFATPSAVARDLPAIALANLPAQVLEPLKDPQFDAPLHRAAVKLQIAFPDPSLLQYDCGKLQMLATLLRERKAGGHRILIFTQMTRILDILEIFLNLHGYLYLRLDGATKIEDRQYITERFNSDSRIFCFISSSRSGGVGINLTGADTVIFYDSDFNPQMDRQCEDRAHRIGQIRDVHIYRFISQHTVEEALLRKANQKRSLDDLVIQKGEFDWRTLFADANEGALTRALGEFEDAEDAQAAQLAAREEMQLVSEDAQDFEAGGGARKAGEAESEPHARFVEIEDGNKEISPAGEENAAAQDDQGEDAEQHEGVEEAGGEEEMEEEGRTTVDYMLDFVREDWEYFGGWNV